MDKKQIRRVLKKAAAVLFVFLLSFVRLFGSAAPFGLPAVLCAGALDPVYLIAFAFGRFFADVGAFGFFRGLLSLTFSLLSGYFFSHRVSKAALCALSTLFSGALLLIVRPSSHLAALMQPLIPL